MQLVVVLEQKRKIIGGKNSKELKGQVVELVINVVKVTRDSFPFTMEK